MTTYTKRVLGAEWTGGGEHFYSYTVPTGKSFILRDVEAKFIDAADHVYVGIGSANYLIFLYPSGALRSAQWQGRIAFAAGEVLGVSVGTHQIGFACTGYLFDG